MKKILGSKAIYHITAVGKTIPFYDLLYKVRDHYETIIDTGSLLSYQFNRSVLEGGTKKYENIRFNRAAQTENNTRMRLCDEAFLENLFH